jgi:predicted RNase H-like nuclease (RuvC/YqgF family)
LTIIKKGRRNIVLEELEHRLNTALYERDYWIEQYHNKETSKVIQQLNEKLESKDETIKRLKEDINYLENKLKVIPFKKKGVINE